MPASPPETRASLILRLPNAADVTAWDEVVAVYAPLVYRLARRKGLQPADADDLVQEVLSAVARSVGRWLERRDRGRFRAWLLRITRNTAINFLTRPKHLPLSPGGGRNIDDLACLPDCDGTPDEFDLEYHRETFRWASKQVRDAIADRTWQAFFQTAVEDRPVAEVARELGMTTGGVYVARGRVMARLRKAVREFEEQEQ